MKKVILLLAIAITGVFAVQAQGQGGPGGFQRRTPEERLKQVKEKVVDLKLDNDQTTKSDSTFMEFFRGQNKMFEEMRAGGAPDREQMREKNQKLAAERDEKLKKIFTEDQFKKWKDEIEPSLRPQRGGNRGGGNGGGNN
jgi:periplasmic protein CpxP/Spy